MGNLPVVYFVTQVGNWGTGSDDVGLIQSTKAPCWELEKDLKGPKRPKGPKEPKGPEGERPGHGNEVPKTVSEVNYRLEIRDGPWPKDLLRVVSRGFGRDTENEFWKPPGCGKSRESRGISHSREIGKFLENASKYLNKCHSMPHRTSHIRKCHPPTGVPRS